MAHDSRTPQAAARRRPLFLLLAPALLPALLFVTPARSAAGANFCSQTADNLFTACKFSVSDDRFVARAICINITDPAARDECFQDADDARKEGLELCQDQKKTRLDTCKLTGEGRYDPVVVPSDFETDFTNLAHPNPFYPLKVGYTWTYEGGGELNTIEILDRTKLIQGATCIVARDEVFKDGALTEGTDDWFAQNVDGDTWYFGEETKSYETFPGDNPALPELVSIDGSFKGGRDGDKPGRIFLASPQVDDVYTEESSLGNAEDVTVILSTTYSYGDDPDLDEFVPAALVDIFCHGDCVVTKNFSLLEPGDFARKYYASGVGVILEVEDGETSQLTNCNFDPRCVGLPQP